MDFWYFNPCAMCLHSRRVFFFWDWAILTHGNCRCDYYRELVFWSKKEKCKHFPSSWIWDFGRISPPGSVAQTRRIQPPGQICQFHPPGLIMTCRVLRYNSNQLNENEAFALPKWQDMYKAHIDMRCQRSQASFLILSLQPGKGRGASGLICARPSERTVLHNCIGGR